LRSIGVEDCGEIKRDMFLAFVIISGLLSQD